VRFVVFGAGAIGGVVGARLHQAGYEVILIARGRHYEVLADGGLRIEDPDESAVLAIPAVNRPDAIDWTEEDVVLLCTKSQDTAPALQALAAAAPQAIAVVCAQNGVENERVALRVFANVYGAVVMVPAAHLEPGLVMAYGTALTGMIEVGRYPGGVDERAEAIAAALAASRFEASAHEDVMRLKYAKLIMNVANAADAMCVPGPATEELVTRARAEAREVLRAARIDFEDEHVSDVRARWRRMGVRDIAGRERSGSSSLQSLARGTGAVEADYLNGEIVLLGREHGVPSPVNELLQRHVDRLARERGEPRSVPAEELLARLE
jgi:2-dehydropantoate 2-reductase